MNPNDRRTTPRELTTFIAGIFFGVSLCADVRSDSLDHWTATNPATNSNITSVAYGNDLFVEVASFAPFSGSLGFSSDGVQWTAANCGGQICTPVSLLAVTFADSRFVAVGDYGWTYMSTNGTDWQLNVVPPTDSTLWDVCYGGGNFVAVGRMDSCPCGFVAVSSDGVTWEPSYIDQILGLRGVSYGNGTYVAVGSSDREFVLTPMNIFTTTNALEPWTTHSVDTTNDLFAVAYGAGRFVAVGEEHFSGQGCLITAVDGETWERIDLPMTNALRNVTFTHGLFFVTGASGTLMTSADGRQWRQRAIGSSRSLGRVISAKGTALIALDDGSFLQSDPLAKLSIGIGERVEFSVTGLEGRFYRIEAASELPNNDWEEVGTFLLDHSPMLWKEGAGPVATSRFYRAVLLPSDYIPLSIQQLFGFRK
jgi:hypothetical protein